MNEKTQRLAGIVIFAALSLVLIWYTDFEDMRFVGFGTRPHGYGSLAYHVVDEFAGNRYYDYRATNFWWALTQLLPFLAAWLLRQKLGTLVGSARRLLAKAYEAV
jgi:hypothetical protein